MAILVTGGTGFLGRHVVELLRSLGEEVRILARKPLETLHGGGDPVCFFRGDILDRGAVVAAATGCRAVIHLAGRVNWSGAAEGLHPLHVEGTRHAIDAARCAGAARFVHVSTSGTVGISRNL